MSISSAEQLRIELNQSLTEISSPREKVFVLASHFNSILGLKSQNLIDAYIPEHIELFINNLKKYDCFGIAPEYTSNLLQTIDELIAINLQGDISDQLKHQKLLIIQKLELLNKSLEGIESSGSKTGVITFPILEKESNRKYFGNGFLESISVHLKRTKEEQKFILVPSGEELEERLHRQLEDSWQIAVNKSQCYLRKKIENYEVIIEFDKKFGFIEGNSLGTALTISFLKEILSFYNSKISITPASSISFTGGMDEQGKVTNFSEVIIKQKTESIFYSDIELFIVPKNDEELANARLNELKEEFPKRDLRIIGIEDINDLLNRRNIVEIKKQLVIVRSGKFVKKNMVAFSLILIIAIMIYFAGWWDLDTNPSIVKNENEWVLVQNKNGKLLWKKKMGFDVRDLSFAHMPSITHKIVDINSDGLNEVILAREIRNDNELISPNGRITCFSSEGDIIWENYFNDEIKSKDMIHSKDYFSFIIDTVKINKTKILMCFADNVLYPGVVYFIDIKNGNRVGTTLWNYGHLHSGKIGDFNKDDRKELVMFGINNAFKRAIVFSIDIDKIEGQLPTDEKKGFIDIKPAKFNNYVLLPKTDYTESLTGNYNSTMWGYFLRNQDSTRIINFLMEGKASDPKGIMIELNGNLEVTKIDPSLEFEIARDSLVSKGIISKPYTNSEEYKKVLWDQIEYRNRDAK